MYWANEEYCLKCVLSFSQMRAAWWLVTKIAYWANQEYCMKMEPLWRIRGRLFKRDVLIGYSNELTILANQKHCEKLPSTWIIFFRTTYLFHHSEEFIYLSYAIDVLSTLLIMAKTEKDFKCQLKNMLPEQQLWA